MIVSEETGRISIAVKGELYYNLSIDDVRMMLIDELRPKRDDELEEEDDAYEEEILKDGQTREVMHFHPFLAPYKAAVLPLVKKHHKEKALEIYKMLSQDLMVIYDETGNIGKRYRREDIAGTPYCITVDDETINNGTVTVRDRDTMKQEIIKVENLKDYLNEKIKL